MNDEIMKKEIFRFSMELVLFLYLFFNVNAAISTPENFYKDFVFKTKEEKAEHCLYCLLKNWEPEPCLCKKEICLELIKENKDEQNFN